MYVVPCIYSMSAAECVGHGLIVIVGGEKAGYVRRTLPYYVYYVRVWAWINGSSARCLALLIARDSALWCRAQVPVLRRGSIRALSET